MAYKTISDVITIGLAYYALPNYIPWNSYLFLSTPILGTVLYFASERKYFKKLVLYSCVLFNTALTIRLIIVGFADFNHSFLSAQAYFFIILSLIFLYDIFISAEHERIAQEPKFWNAANILFHFAGLVFIFTFGKYIGPEDNYIWTIIVETVNSAFSLFVFWILWIALRK